MESHNSCQNEEMFNYSIVRAAGYRDISENLRFLMFAKLKKEGNDGKFSILLRTSIVPYYSVFCTLVENNGTYTKIGK